MLVLLAWLMPVAAAPAKSSPLILAASPLVPFFTPTCYANRKNENRTRRHAVPQ
ncbi:hypothetical protein ACIBQX_13620 [Nonomuraea sp. NPDC049714]|uniref:hypothetical protein n=1 Tax=Nonomuraea sp. NPDC049714 TaxID=3364357 RepID=UPI003798A305